ncbi:MAG: hypothetical protein HC871_04345 [Rhizobiales bacterium]|nr:hypothetical protein [Hyphomicrobiales bacterium]
MRHGKVMAGLVVAVIAGCTSSAPLKDMVGYVPPTSLPAQPKRTLVADSEDRVWTELVAFLESSAFELDHVDPESHLLVARYSGDPEPFIDCGSIVIHQGGTLGQIAGSVSNIALNYELDDEPVVLNRLLNLDSRIIVRLARQAQGTVIRTDTTYVVTKIVDVTDLSGAVREGSRETVSFEAGNRGEFSKGTACQPNGSLDLAVLQSLPNIVGSDEIDRAELTDDDGGAGTPTPWAGDVVAALPQAEPTTAPPETSEPGGEAADVARGQVESLDAATIPAPASEDAVDDWVLPERGLPTAAQPVAPQVAPAPRASEGGQQRAPSPGEETGSLASPLPVPGTGLETAAIAPDETPAAGAASGSESPATIVEDTTRKLLESLDCAGAEWHFCDLVQVTTPYRKRNIENLFGLTVNTTESFTSQVVGSDLKLDVLFPNFPSHMHIAYARRDGLIEHVTSTPDVWPADLVHQIAATGKTIPGPAGLAMIIAIASDQPLFSTPPDGPEDAKAYLERLKQRLGELDKANPGGQIAASQLLIFVEDART